MRGDEPYKKNWETLRRSLYSLSLCRSARVTSVSSPVTHPLTLLKGKRGIVLDLDGVMYNGDRPIESSIRAVQMLMHDGVSVGFLSNASVLSAEAIAEKLSRFGIVVDNERIVTSSIATAIYL